MTETERWRGIAAVTFLSAAVALLFTAPGALLVGVVGGAYAGYARFDTAPSPRLSVERAISDTDPERGDEVSVTVTVHNDGGFLPDLRLVDGVPDSLEVTEGSPRLATALRAGKEASFSYRVEARRGDHAFGDLTVVARDAAGSVEVETTADVAGDDAVRCVPELDALDGFPLRAQATRQVGRLTTNEGGTGVEFHATREYRRGDPLSRLDWQRLARTGDLATVEFREERAGTAVLVVDTREQAYVTDPDGESAVERSVGAAGAVADALLDAGDRVGVASYGPRTAWLPPGLGRDHRQRLRRALALDDAFDPLPPDAPFFGRTTLTRLLTRLPSDAQVVCVTPLVDDGVAAFARRLDAHGHAVTVVSPDPTGGTEVGETLARVERRLRVRSVRRAGIRVLDWEAGTPLAVALATAERRWRA
ncbi:DUF58 domain-containing protein [Salarchaeum sp. JOR-1]|uniref:DUF58 domain-containing protein n=1 Tax=Salarchaeum sp. JOR-1 TaxID=2599399 RepID=UPI0011986593|nr:DUF58 domain-containing protein [Salarchaeum sp. JOR-1]QDX39828.1 DUF58 domain-containing protein [Salarchaeum sp. JOR-1]